ncbi:putative zn 2cys6 transcription factor [Rosellinia necatrix]|uniref:Putative zn 2cys6 transcription factor n=1 Tax=Rosellinia necatrix TaxID=77044 RepID=A0A1S7UJB1_ROSNE|nr:putative zn 2cys6 transcription factor [Rosellinia necatrix]
MAQPQRKVRLACQRCRTRRIKCDGQTPACSNCAKVGETCLDVDAQNADIVTPRNFASTARARIQWLENIIRNRLPDVDLTSGPRVDIPPAATTSTRIPEDALASISPASSGLQPLTDTQPSSLKRTFEESSPLGQDEPLSARAHSVALDLGRVSLNSDSIQRHYLGSSSGLLFTSLICVSPSSTRSESGKDAPPSGVLPRGAFVEHYRSLHVLLRRTLPDRQDSILLAQTYLRWIHPHYPVLEPSSLLDAIEALYHCASCHSSSIIVDGGWPESLPGFRWNGQQVPNVMDGGSSTPLPVIAFIAFMIFNIAAIIQVRSRVYDHPPAKYYRTAVQFSADCFSHMSLSTIQALTMLIIHSSYTPAETNLWTLVHIGLAQCVELGIHREHAPTSPEEERSVKLKRYVFYTMYSIDRTISSIQGRPLGFRDETFDVKRPGSDDESPSDDDSLPNRGIELFSAYRFELDEVISDIKTQLYLLPSRSVRFHVPSHPIDDQKRINDTLQSWWRRIASHNNEFSAIWRLKLQIKFHTTMILLFQPSQAIRNPCEESLQAVFNSASYILQGYQNLHDQHGLHYGWKSVQNIFAAGAALIYSFWTSATVQDSANSMMLSRDLRTCSSLLSVGGEWWPSVRKSLLNLGSIIDLTIQRLYTKGPPLKQPRLPTQQPNTSTTEGNTYNFERGGAVHGFDSAGNPSTSSICEYPPTNGNDSHIRDWSTMDPAEPEDPANRLPGQWPEGYTDIEQGIAPEIETFLADFDESNFSWSFPPGGVDQQLEMPTIQNVLQSQ